MWDQRDWTLALKAPNPIEFYNEAKKVTEEAEAAPKIDDLPNKDWLRQT